MSDNLNGSERRPLKSLSSDDSVVIRNADKGGSVVILDSIVYREEALWQLSETDTYQKLRADPTSPFKKELSTLLDRAVCVCIFSKKERDLFIPVSNNTSVFTISPKSTRG